MEWMPFQDRISQVSTQLTHIFDMVYGIWYMEN